MTKPNLNAVILLPRLQVQNANAISGPLSWGFPAPSAFLGFVHALQRQVDNGALKSDDLDLDEDLRFDGVAVIAHRFDPQISSEGYRHRFILTKNPISKVGYDKNGNLKGASFVEEGRAHLEVTLLVGVHGVPFDEDEQEILARRVAEAAQLMRIAGGSLLPQRYGERYTAQFKLFPESPENQPGFARELRRWLLPGFALLHRQDLLAEHLADLQQTQPELTSLDALLDLVQLKHDPVAVEAIAEEGADEDEASTQEAGDKAGDKATPKVEWRTHRARPGWLVPLPVGYGAISDLHAPGSVKNARDPSVPFRFVESLYSLGEWRSPHRVDNIKDLFWFYKAQPELGLYLCDHDTNEHDAHNQGV